MRGYRGGGGVGDARSARVCGARADTPVHHAPYSGVRVYEIVCGRRLCFRRYVDTLFKPRNCQHADRSAATGPGRDGRRRGSGQPSISRLGLMKCRRRRLCGCVVFARGAHFGKSPFTGPSVPCLCKK
ncbi:hypothetical protein MTO96_002572 [Rhipicephalus appendiculatus]